MYLKATREVEEIDGRINELLRESDRFVEEKEYMERMGRNTFEDTRGLIRQQRSGTNMKDKCKEALVLRVRLSKSSPDRITIKSNLSRNLKLMYVPESMPNKLHRQKRGANEARHSLEISPPISH